MDIKTVNELKSRSDLNYVIRTNNGRTPLHYAAEKGSLDLVQFILKQKGVYINETTNSGLSALHYSAERNKVEVVEYLLSDANINAGAQDIKGFCAKGIQFINGKYIYSP